MVRWLLLSCALVASGCDAAAPLVDGSVPPGRDAATIDAAPLDAALPDGAAPPDGGPDVTGDAGGEDRDAGGGGPRTMLCQLGCTTSADCTTASPAFDADNYRCDGGACVYEGCNDDAECQATFSSDRYVCRDAGTGQPACVIGCATPSDCNAGSAAFDADNYRCSAGACIYEGCNDDTECTSTFGAGYGCRAVSPPDSPLPVPEAERNCVRLCSTASDCGTDAGAYGDDNYTCDGDACRYAGCNDDAECRASLSSDAYVCR